MALSGEWSEGNTWWNAFLGGSATNFSCLFQPKLRGELGETACSADPWNGKTPTIKYICTSSRFSCMPISLAESEKVELNSQDLSSHHSTTEVRSRTGRENKLAQEHPEAKHGL